jgi:hypothetical protein
LYSDRVKEIGDDECKQEETDYRTKVKKEGGDNSNQRKPND